MGTEEPVSDGQGGAGQGGKYMVVARRYRPRSFHELVGQENVSQALETAIRTGRVGHAYLFTGARGVGKTSTARIFAKAVNAVQSDGRDPLTQDIAEAIDAGQDMDVIEIDGASNRGIEEIRSLRANVNVRPSRSRYKIYIIDEVHMLTVQAFNALLKTLEEPPEHVKFIFCTTDPEKIPITVLSRCQRFDFSPVKTEAILERLQFICEQEKAIADVDALRLVARRAAGSMRDSQSLLEQILSFSDGKITVEQVHAVLGSADETLLLETLHALLMRQPAKVVEQVDLANSQGVDPGQFGEQLLGYLRDTIVAGIGGSLDLLRSANPSTYEQLKAYANQWGLNTLLAAVQLLDDALVKMRHSVQNRILLEVALIQICQLQDLQRISDLLAMLQQGAVPVPAPQVRSTVPPPASPSPSSPSPTPATTPSSAAVVAAAHADVPKAQSTPAAVTNADTVPAASRQVEGSPTPQDKTSSPSTQAPQAPASSAVTKPKPDEKKNVEVAEDLVSSVPAGTTTESPISATETASSATETASPDPFPANASAWDRVVALLDSFLAGYIGLALRAKAISNEEWQVVFPSGSDLAVEFCRRPEHLAQMQTALSKVLGKTTRVNIVLSDEPPIDRKAQEKERISAPQQVREANMIPFIARICTELGGEVVRVDAAHPTAKPPTTTKSEVEATVP